MADTYRPTGEYFMVSDKQLEKAKKVNPRAEKITTEVEKVKPLDNEIHIQLSEQDHKLIEYYAKQHDVPLQNAYNAVISHSLGMFRKVINFVESLD